MTIQDILRTAIAHEQAASDFRSISFARYMETTETVPKTHREHGEHELAYSLYENARTWHEQAAEAVRVIQQAEKYLA